MSDINIIASDTENDPISAYATKDNLCWCGDGQERFVKAAIYYWPERKVIRHSDQFRYCLGHLALGHQLSRIDHILNQVKILYSVSE